MYINENIGMNNKISQQRCLSNIDVIYTASINKNIRNYFIKSGGLGAG